MYTYVYQYCTGRLFLHTNAKRGLNIKLMDRKKIYNPARPNTGKPKSKWYDVGEYQAGDRVYCVIFRLGKSGTPAGWPELRQLEVTRKYPDGMYMVSEEGIVSAEDMFTSERDADAYMRRCINVCIEYYRQQIENGEKLLKAYGG